MRYQILEAYRKMTEMSNTNISYNEEEAFLKLIIEFIKSLEIEFTNDDVVLKEIKNKIINKKIDFTFSIQPLKRDNQISDFLLNIADELINFIKNLSNHNNDLISMPLNLFINDEGNNKKYMKNIIMLKIEEFIKDAINDHLGTIKK